MTKREYRYVFGPVPSRRLGRSLGVDLTPFKTCTLDCVFCQLGRTTEKTITRKEYVPVSEVTSEIGQWLASGGEADHITLSGSGEPTLHARFGNVLQFAREQTNIPLALLSNGTLFWERSVREAAALADVVKLSLSAWDAASFGHVNRPHAELRFRRQVAGYRAFREMYRGKLWIEVMLLWGTNSTPHDVERIAAIVNDIGADEIHLNTSVRPPAETFAVPVQRAHMESLAELFRPPAEVIAECTTTPSAETKVNEATILSMLRRRPCTAPQIATVFGMHLNEISKYLGELVRTNRIQAEYAWDGAYFTAKEEAEVEHVGA